MAEEEVAAGQEVAVGSSAPAQGAAQARRGRPRVRTRDEQSALEARVTRVEEISVEMAGRVETAEEIIERLDATVVELREDLDSARNELREKDAMLERVQAMESRMTEQQDLILRQEGLITALSSQVMKLEGELNVQRAALTGTMAGGLPAAQPTAKVEIPKPKAFAGSRNAKEIDNFVWSMESYFEAAGIRDNAGKLRTIPLFLHDVAILWWRRRCEDAKRGTCTLDTWEDFKRELKAMFYPEDAEREARAKLRRLTHKGPIRDYVDRKSVV